MREREGGGRNLGQPRNLKTRNGEGGSKAFFRAMFRV